MLLLLAQFSWSEISELGKDLLFGCWLAMLSICALSNESSAFCYSPTVHKLHLPAGAINDRLLKSLIPCFAFTMRVVKACPSSYKL